MAEILPIRRKTLSNQSINQYKQQMIFWCFLVRDLIMSWFTMTSCIFLFVASIYEVDFIFFKFRISCISQMTNGCPFDNSFENWRFVSTSAVQIFGLYNLKSRCFFVLDRFPLYTVVLRKFMFCFPPKFSFRFSLDSDFRSAIQ